MSQSVYSVYGSPIHLILDDDFVSAYNRAQDAFVQAQKDHLTRTGSPWTGLEQMLIHWTDEEQAAFNNFAGVMNSIIELNGGGIDLTEEQMPSLHLVKL